MISPKIKEDRANNGNVKENSSDKRRIAKDILEAIGIATTLGFGLESQLSISSFTTTFSAFIMVDVTLG